jgi:hypothetical protein
MDEWKRGRNSKDRQRSTDAMQEVGREKQQWMKSKRWYKVGKRVKSVGKSIQERGSGHPTAHATTRIKPEKKGAAAFGVSR